MEKNPDNLKIHDDKPSDYLNADDFATDTQKFIFGVGIKY